MDVVELIAKVFTIAVVPVLVLLRRMHRTQLKILRYTRAIAEHIAPEDVTGPVKMIEPPIAPRMRGSTRAPRRPAPAFGVTVIRRAGTSGRDDDDKDG